MTIVKDEYGKHNVFAKEPKMYITEKDKMRNEEKTYAERAERLNGLFAMIGFVAAVGAYLMTGQIIPGVL